MGNSYRERLRRLHMIQGAIFTDHTMHRAEERLGLSDFDAKKFERNIVELDGDIFYDRKHENYQIAFNGLAFAFDLQLHYNRPGLLAYVKTTVSDPNDYRDDDDRFERLRPEDYRSCEQCELAVKKSSRTGCETRSTQLLEKVITLSRENWITRLELEEAFDVDDLGELLQNLIDSDLMRREVEEETKYYQLTEKFVYLKRHGMEIEEIIERADEFDPEKVDEKIDRIQEIVTSADKEGRDLTEEERNEIKELAAGPYVRAFIENYLGGGFEIDFGAIEGQDESQKDSEGGSDG